MIIVFMASAYSLLIAHYIIAFQIGFFSSLKNIYRDNIF